MKTGLIAAIGVAAVAVMAPSAMATNTALCKVHQEPCQAANLWGEIHVVSVGRVDIETSLLDVECSALFKATLLGLAAPQIAHETADVMSECTAGEAGECTVTETALGLYRLLKTALNLGTVATGGRREKVECEIGINCEYEEPESATPVGTMEGAGHRAGSGHGMFNIGPVSLNKVSGFFCPASAEYQALYEPLADFYIVS